MIHSFQDEENLAPDSPSSSGKRCRDDAMPGDMEDIGQRKVPSLQGHTPPSVTKHTLTLSQQLGGQRGGWRKVLGPPPERGTTKVGEVSH